MPAFCLKLNSHQTHVIDAFQKLYNEELLVDCTLSCSGGTVKAHKLVLSACSPYFTNLFSTFTNPSQYPVIFLKDMSFQELKLIIEFMYKGEITVPQNLLPSILESAKALMITGLREIKVANIETGKSGDSPPKPNRRGRKRRHKTIDSIESSAGESERSEIELSDNEIQEKIARNELNMTGNSVVSTASITGLTDAGVQTIGVNEETTDQPPIYDLTDDQQVTAPEIETNPISENNLILSSTTGTNTSTISTSTLLTTDCSPSVSVSNSAKTGPSTSASITKMSNIPANFNSKTPTSLKNTLKQLRIEKSASALTASGRKMWSEEETRVLIRIWEEESARVWASAGKKSLSLKRISDLLTSENIDRDISQVEGKIKALRRDYKAVKQDKAIPAIQTKMAPYLEKLEAIFSREEMV